MFLQSKQPCIRAVEGSPSSGWWYLRESNMESNENACVHYCNLISNIWNKQMKEFKNILVNSPSCIILICSLTCILWSLLYVLASQTTNVLCDECLGWWMSEVVNVWGGERLILHWGWWTSDFTLGVVNVWSGECLGGERLTIFYYTEYLENTHNGPEGSIWDGSPSSSFWARRSSPRPASARRSPSSSCPSGWLRPRGWTPQHWRHYQRLVLPSLE